MSPEPGEIKVVAYKNGKEWATASSSTIGATTKIQLDSETIGRLTFVTASIVDELGRGVHTSDQNLRFTTSGDAELLAASNGNATSLLTMNRPKTMPTYHGKCRIILEGNGQLNVAADGVTTSSITFPK